MAVKNNAKDKAHTCPYCDEAIAEAAFPYCQACGLKVLRCPACEMVVPKDTRKCPHCGADIKKTIAGGG